MKILVTGYFGAGNFGDDIMLDAFLKKVRKEHPEIEVYLLKFLGGDILIDSLEKDKIIEVTKYKSIFRDIKISLTILKFDCIIWIGGTCFTDQEGDGFFKYGIITKLFRKKLGYLGVGIGNLSKAERITKTHYILNIADFLTFRDENSYQYALKVLSDNNVFSNYCWGQVPRGYLSMCKILYKMIYNKDDKSKTTAVDKIAFTEDLAYSYIHQRLNDKNSNIKNNNIKNNNSIIVSWRNLDNFLKPNLELDLMDETVKFIYKLTSLENIDNIIVLPLDDRKDLDKNKIVYNKLKNIFIENSCISIQYLDKLTPYEKYRTLIQCKLNICGRLHGAFVTEIFNIKTIALSYSIKIDEFLKSVGKQSDCVDIFNLNEDILLQAYNQNNNKLDDEFIKAKIDNSLKNFEIMFKFLR
jgi:polysaccharide pyruvyl transferase WcaK-like protein